jgi:hypothetical protein
MPSSQDGEREGCFRPRQNGMTFPDSDSRCCAADYFSRRMVPDLVVVKNCEAARKIPKRPGFASDPRAKSCGIAKS